jgi:putative phosphoesterase
VRIGLISDIHVDLNRIEGKDLVTGLLAREAARRSLDILLVAGDISSDYALTLRTIAALEAQSGVRVLFVPGNHDIWNENYPGRTAWESYNALLEHPGNLARGAVALGAGWTAVGDLGWYDFAYGDPSFSQADFQRMKYGERTWQDLVKSIWDRPTLDMHRHFMDRLDAQLGKAAVVGATDSGTRKLLFVTHVVQIREFTVQNPGPEWKYFNAFLGSPDYGDLARRHGAELAVCGHVHYRRQALSGGTRFVCPCLGYAKEWPLPLDPARQIAETLQVFDLGPQGAVPEAQVSVGNPGFF